MKRTIAGSSLRSASLGRSLFHGLLLVAGFLLLQISGAADQDDVQPPAAFAMLLTIDGPIGPATSDYVGRGLLQAQEQGARAVILQMDTPGGLDTSMRKIIRAIIRSPVPVLTYVAPGGARAASAGTYILYASHIAAMAPGTNVGAATPVQMLGGGAPADRPEQDKDGTEASDDAGNKAPEEDGRQDAEGVGGDAMQHKLINDAVAYIRSLAELRGRNADWAEQAVRQAESLSAEAAAERKVVDFVAADVPDLLRQADGRSVDVAGNGLRLATAGLSVQRLEPDWRSRLLAVITNPNVAYVLMLIGIYGLFFEFANPGFIVPGVAGAIALVLALYALHVLPVNYAGLALIVLGIAFMVGEAFVPSFGALGIGGVIAFVFGSIILMDTDSEFYAISRPLIFAVALVSAAVFIGIAMLAVRSYKRPVVSGQEALVGDTAVAMESFSGEGLVRAQGEVWQARSETGVTEGQHLRIKSIEGLVLHVEAMAEET